MINYMNFPVTRMRVKKAGVISRITVIDKLGSNRRAKAKHHFSATHEHGSSYINRCAKLTSACPSMGMQDATEHNIWVRAMLLECPSHLLKSFQHQQSFCNHHFIKRFRLEVFKQNRNMVELD